MKSFFSKILIAQVIAVVLALLVMAFITRASLNQGFRTFLANQEKAVLQAVVPVLETFYQQRGSWDQLKDRPRAWQHIWRSTRGQVEERPPRRPGERRPADRQPPPPPVDPSNPNQLRWMRLSDRGLLRERLFLLAADKQHVAGAAVESLDGIDLQAVTAGGETVGWIGFTPMGDRLPREAERFFRDQVKNSVIALAVALVIAAALALMLARSLSRPVRRLDHAVRKLSEGKYGARVQHSAGDETGRLARHVNQLAGTLENNRTARRRWMAEIAHELRTPVAILKGEVEALADGVRAADERLVSSLVEEIEQLSALIDDLQTLALSDAGALNIHKERIRYDRIVLQAADSYRERLAQRDIELRAELEPLDISADPQRLRQLLQNLLENCCRYVEPGGTVLITLKAIPSGRRLCIEDSGPGLSEAQTDRLFERFYRAEQGRSRASGGTGLGLAICRNIAEAHGGQISATAAPLGGLRIQLDLPD